MNRLVHFARISPIASRYYSTSAGGSKVAFIGLGNMGGHMARNLVKAGHSLSVFDLSAEAMDAVVGGKACDSPQEACDGAEVVITMLPSSPHVRETYDAVFDSLGPAAVCIDSSTIDPAVAKSVSNDAHSRGFTFVDAPVSGGVGGAEAGTLTFMCGGPEVSYESAVPILKSMGQNIVHCGDSGTGQVAKLCNNMMLGISMIGASETMNMGVRLGIDAKLLAGILNTSTGRSWSTEVYNPCPGVVETAPAGRGYTGGFGSALMNKDLGLAMDAAGDVGAATPLGSLAHEIYTEMSQTGYAEKDFSSAYEWLNELAAQKHNP